MTIIKDGDKYLMYYRGLPVLAGGTEDECTCYAESRDGIHWVRPNLGLYEVHGTRENNVVLHGQSPVSPQLQPFSGYPPRRRPHRAI